MIRLTAGDGSVLVVRASTVSRASARGGVISVHFSDGECAHIRYATPDDALAALRDIEREMSR